MSQVSSSSVKSKRALDLLTDIKQSTNPQTHASFLSLLGQFRKKQVSSVEVHKQVQVLLADHPALLEK
jgi:histone deacetylase complex regulatory component SIN3